MWLALLTACSAPEPGDSDSDVDPIPTADTGPMPIERVWRGGIKPLFEERCQPCHTGYTFGDLDVRQLDGLVDVPSSTGMALLTPGSLEESYVWHKIEDTHHDVGGTGERMPLDALPFQEHERSALSEWILAGAPLN